jgi:DNA-binding PadR family transcriptional regulator
VLQRLSEGRVPRELTLLAVRALGEPAYGVPVQQFVERATGRAISMGAIYATLTRLEAKGFLRSIRGEATAIRGGKRKKLFEVTPDGLRMARESRRVRERLWQAIEADRRS